MRFATQQCPSGLTGRAPKSTAPPASWALVPFHSGYVYFNVYPELETAPVEKEGPPHSATTCYSTSVGVSAGHLHADFTSRNSDHRIRTFRKRRITYTAGPVGYEGAGKFLSPVTA